MKTIFSNLKKWYKLNFTSEWRYCGMFMVENKIRWTDLGYTETMQIICTVEFNMISGRHRIKTKNPDGGNPIKNSLYRYFLDKAKKIEGTDLPNEKKLKDIVELVSYVNTIKVEWV